MYVLLKACLKNYNVIYLERDGQQPFLVYPVVQRICKVGTSITISGFHTSFHGVVSISLVALACLWSWKLSICTSGYS